MTLIAGIFFFFILLSGAIGWISSGGDRQKIESARQRVFNGVIGIVVVVAAIFIVQFAGGIIGFPDILNPESTISRLYSGGTVEPAAWVICRGNDTGCDQVCSPSRGWSGCSNECTGSFCSVPSGTYLLHSNNPPPFPECLECQNFPISCGDSGAYAIYCCCQW